MPPLQLVLAKAVRAERARSNLTQAELGERLGWARSTISAIEAGDRDLLATELPAVCRALGVPLRELLRDADARDRDALGL